MSLDKEISVEEFLAIEPRDLEVPAGREVVVDPSVDRFQDRCHRVALRSFDDLRGMRLIPGKLEEEAALEALAADEAEALAAARRIAERQGEAHECSCSDASSGVSRQHGGRWESSEGGPRRQAYPELVRQVYGQVRRAYNTHLAKVVSQASGVAKVPQGLQLAETQGILGRFVAEKAWSFDIFYSLDITVGKNATLSISHLLQTLRAKDIRIHTGGKIKVQGSFLKIDCKSIRGGLP